MSSNSVTRLHVSFITCPAGSIAADGRTPSPWAAEYMSCVAGRPRRGYGHKQLATIRPM
jgi:hypothetical protein